MTTKKATTDATTETNVYHALRMARREFDPVLKDSTNPHFKNKYASLQSVLTAVETALDRHGLVLVQRTRYENGVCLLVTELVHCATGQVIESVYPLLPKETNNPQALGGALTYARRYSVLAVLGVAPEDDDGQQASKPARRADAPLPKTNATPAEDAEVQAALRFLGEAPDVATLKARFRKLDQAMRDHPTVNKAAKALQKTLEGRAA